MGERHRERRAAEKRAALRLGIRVVFDEFGHMRTRFTKAEYRRRRLRDHFELVEIAKSARTEIMQLLADRVATDIDRLVLGIL